MGGLTKTTQRKCLVCRKCPINTISCFYSRVWVQSSWCGLSRSFSSSYEDPFIPPTPPLHAYPHVPSASSPASPSDEVSPRSLMFNYSWNRRDTISSSKNQTRFLLPLNSIRDTVSWCRGVCVCQMYGTGRLTWVHFFFFTTLSCTSINQPSQNLMRRPQSLGTGRLGSSSETFSLAGHWASFTLSFLLCRWGGCHFLL